LSPRRFFRADAFGVSTAAHLAPVVLFDDRIAGRIPAHKELRIAAAIFAVLGVATLPGAEARSGF